ncbi:MAG: HAD family hydrolase [Chitinophagaceae bacterium]|nr:HAD family hydrolase [Rubrivivax sp.]
MKLALFDLDGTLLPNDSDHAFGEFIVGLGWASAAEHRLRNDAFFRDYEAGTLDIQAYVEFATAPWRARSPHELAHVMQRFLAEVVQPVLHPSALALVERHRRAGDCLAVVTATNDFVTRPIARLFGISDLIATDLARDAEGRVTGAIAGMAAFREGKVARVRAWLAARGWNLSDFEASTFYSDSTNDLPLLEQVSHPVATNPGPALARVARERGWPILELFT